MRVRSGARAKCWKPNSAASVNAALAISSVRGRVAIAAATGRSDSGTAVPVRRRAPAHTVNHAGSNVNAPSQQAMLPTAAITPNWENPRKLVVPSARYDAEAASAAVNVGRAVVAIAADSA